MTDKELLKLAAKTAGYTEIIYRSSGLYVRESRDDEWMLWNPLEDDGDAFRLLLSIGADVYHGTSEYDEPIITIQAETMPLSDAPSALRDSASEIRRAIVRAAASVAGDACKSLD